MHVGGSPLHVPLTMQVRDSDPFSTKSRPQVYVAIVPGTLFGCETVPLVGSCSCGHSTPGIIIIVHQVYIMQSTATYFSFYNLLYSEESVTLSPTITHAVELPVHMILKQPTS